MDRAPFVKRLRELSEERGGHIGFRAFLEEIGKSEQWLRGQAWFPGWNALLTELQIPVRRFAPPTRSVEHDLNVLADLVIKYERWPTEDEFRRERAAGSLAPSPHFIRKLRRSGELEQLRKVVARSRPDWLFVVSSGT